MKAKVKLTDIFHDSVNILQSHLKRIESQRAIDAIDVKIIQLGLSFTDSRDEAKGFEIIEDALKHKYFRKLLDEYSSKNKPKAKRKKPRNSKNPSNKKGPNNK